MRTVKLSLTVAAALTLAACQHQGGVEVRTVQVPVPQPCLTIDAIPTEPPRVADSLTGNAAADLPLVAASALELRAWGQEMHAALTACAATSTSEPPNVSSEQSGG